MEIPVANTRATADAATPPRSPVVTAMAMISIVLGIACTAYGVLQAVMVSVFVRNEPLKGALVELKAVDLPAFAEWLLSHLPAASWSFTLLSGAFLASSVGLLKRREWGRQTFIVFMVVGAAVNFLGVWLLMAVFDWVESLPMAAESLAMQAELARLRVVSLATMTGSAVVFAALHAGIVYQLCTSAVRAEFRR
jgi:hypothetical protein